MKEKYRSLSEKLGREQSELEMLSLCFGESPKLGMKTVNSYMKRTRSDRYAPFDKSNSVEVDVEMNSSICNYFLQGHSV